MAAVLIQMVPLGLAAAASPVPIIAGVTLTGTPRPRLSVGAYVLGGLLAYIVVGTIGVTLVNQSSDLGNHGHPSRLALVIQALIGCLFLLVALFSVITRHHQTRTPRWMSALQQFGPGRAFLTGIIVLSPRVKNLLLLIAALTAIGAARVGFLGGAAALLLFVAITLSPALAPLYIQLTRPPEQAAVTTAAWRSWLERNNRLILAIVFGVMGLELLREGLVGLLT